MNLHRVVMRGQRFYNWITRPALNGDLVKTLASISTRETPTFQPLPVFDFLGLKNEAYINALLGELPRGRKPFRNYPKNRVLGIGAISGVSRTHIQHTTILSLTFLPQPPSPGTTTMISVAGLAIEATFGKILASGPTDAAVSSLARRLDQMAQSVCARYNQGKAQNNPSRARHKLVIPRIRSLEGGRHRHQAADGRRVLFFSAPARVEAGAIAGLLAGTPAWALCRGGGGWAPSTPTTARRSTACGGRSTSTQTLPTSAPSPPAAWGGKTCRWARRPASSGSPLPGLIGAVVDAADFLAVTPAQAAASPYETWMRRAAQGVRTRRRGE